MAMNNKKLQTIIEGVAVMVSLSVLIYLMFCFGTWEWNPGKWASESRGFYATVIFAVIFLSFAYIAIERD